MRCHLQLRRGPHNALILHDDHEIRLNNRAVAKIACDRPAVRNEHRLEQDTHRRVRNAKALLRHLAGEAHLIADRRTKALAQEGNVFFLCAVGIIETEVGGNASDRCRRVAGNQYLDDRIVETGGANRLRKHCRHCHKPGVT